MRIPPIRRIRMPLAPGMASVINLCHRRRIELDILLPFKNLQSQARRRMPRNMTVHDPRTRVIRLETNHKIAVAGQQRHIATGRILRVQFDERSPVRFVGLG